jgi:flagellar biosynthetic protein FliR
MQAVMLAATRLTIGLAMTPLFSAFGLPMLARLILILTLAALAVDATGMSALHAPDMSFAYFAPALANEAAKGLLLSVGVHAAFAAFAIAGRLIDTQMGFTLGAVLDPVSKGHTAVVASGFNLLAVVLFFSSDAYQLVFTGYFRTFELMPIGQGASVEGWYPALAKLSLMFSMGFVIAAPVTVALWLADVAVAVISRNLPQMNVLFLSIPIKVLLGLSVMAVSLDFLAPAANKALLIPLTLLDTVQ